MVTAPTSRGTAAGIGVGVAPDALLFAYKIFGASGSSSDSIIVAAIERALDPNQDGVLDDRVDIINMSLGSAFGRPDDPPSLASNNASLLGVVVVASAGNSGDTPYISSSPAVAGRAISVAASIDLLDFLALTVNSPASIAGELIAVEGAITTPLIATGALTAALSATTPTDGCDPISEDLSGEIALIRRGGCSFSSKVLNAQGAGAIAVVVDNNMPGAPIVMGGGSTGISIPGVMITRSAGDSVRGAMVDEGLDITLDPTKTITTDEFADTLTDFTSRGPAWPNSALKPDLSAPGFNITSTAAGTGEGEVDFSGTSMAAPHVSGVSALMRQLHPNFNAEEIKALLMNNAVQTVNLDGTAHRLSIQGGGRVQAFAAAERGSLALGDPGTASLSYGFQVAGAQGKELTIEKEVRVINFSDQNKDFAVSFDSIVPLPGVTLEFPPSVNVPAGDEETFRVEMSIDGSLIRPDQVFSESDGYLILTETTGGADELRLPVHVVTRSASDTQPDSDELKFDAAELNTPQSLRLTNRGIVPGSATFFSLAAEDVDEVTVSDEFDLHFAGARSFPTDAFGRVIEFGVSNFGRWATPIPIEFDVLVDSLPGRPFPGSPDFPFDFIVFNVDLGQLSGFCCQEVQVTSVFVLPAGPILPQFAVFTGGGKNESVMGLPVRAADIGVTLDNPQFTYTVFSFDRFSETFDFLGTVDPVVVSFDAFNPALTTTPPSISFLDQKTEVMVRVNPDTFQETPTEGLLILSPSDGPPPQNKQAQFIPIFVR